MPDVNTSYKDRNNTITELREELRNSHIDDSSHSVKDFPEHLQS